MYKLKKLKIVSLMTIIVIFMTSVAFASSISDNISTNNMYDHLVKIASKDNARVTGTDGEHKAADYISGQFEKYGLDVKTQKFDIKASLNSASCEMTEPENRSFESKNFEYTPSTPVEGLSSELVYAGLGSSSDFADINVKGKIALIKRGSYSFYDKTQNAAKAGAIGVIIFNNNYGPINSGTLGATTDIPAIAISNEDGSYLKSNLEDGQIIKINMRADNIQEDSYSQNIIGTMNSDKLNAQTIVIGAHYDCVDTPGANDNGSGAVSLLEIARILSSRNLDYNIKFVAFGAEEVGLVGSKEYVNSLTQSELNNIKCMINIDMVGVGDTLGIFTSSKYADSFIADLTQEYAEKFNIKYVRKAIDRSDHAPFEAVGIPVSFLMYEQDYNYHTDNDIIENIQLEDLENTCKVVIEMVNDMGTRSYSLKESKTSDIQCNNESEVKQNNYDKSKLKDYNFENSEFVKE